MKNDVKDDLRQLFIDVLPALDPAGAVQRAVHELAIDGDVKVVALGKAAASMACAARVKSASQLSTVVVCSVGATAWARTGVGTSEIAVSTNTVEMMEDRRLLAVRNTIGEKHE